MSAASWAALWPNAQQLAAFALAVFVLNATPGVDLLLTLSRTWRGGARAGMATAMGITVGCALHAAAAAFGLAALLAVHPTAFLALQWAGAAYLVWLGAQMLRSAARRAVPEAGPQEEPVPVTRLGADFRRGVMTNVLNPKVALFFLAFLPPFVPASSPDKTLSFLVLGAWFVLQGGLFLLGVVAMASRLSRLGAPGPLKRALDAVGGVLFIALALRMLKERQIPT